MGVDRGEHRVDEIADVFDDFATDCHLQETADAGDGDEADKGQSTQSISHIKLPALVQAHSKSRPDHRPIRPVKWSRDRGRHATAGTLGRGRP